jgi:phosphatidylethanolamine-binding protein (PEBP) family uncharacterized protein
MLRGVRAGERGLLWNSEAGRDAPGSIELVSEAFDSGASIPRRHAGDGVGENLSPPLAWRNIPHDTAELALVIEDADAPLPRPFVHTVVTAIPPQVSRLSEGALAEGTQHPGVFGKGSFGGRGYRGPTPVPDHGLQPTYSSSSRSRRRYREIVLRCRERGWRRRCPGSSSRAAGSMGRTSDDPFQRTAIGLIK